MSELREALRTLVANGLPNDAVVPIVNGLVEADSLDDCDDAKWLAIVSELGPGMLDADESTYDGYVFQVGKTEYLVLTEDERDSRWDDYLEAWLDDGCVEGADSPYFDREAWKHDARIDGAGVLSSYDGTEYEFSGFGKWYYIYRTN
jgi:hypothetical protein